MSYNVLLERLLKDVGGCGRFQLILALVISLSIVMECWSMLHMSFIGQEPNYFCVQNNNGDNFLLNRSEESIRTTSCASTNATDCSRRRFEDDIHTVVSEVIKYPKVHLDIALALMTVSHYDPNSANCHELTNFRIGR